MSVIAETDGIADEVIAEVFWKAVNSAFDSLGFTHGPPLGWGEHHITTLDPKLNEMIAPINDPLAPNYDPNPQPFKDADGKIWTVHRKWRLRREWQGRYGFLIILYCQETDKYKKVLIPDYPSHRRFGLVLETLGLRNSFSWAESELVAQKTLFEFLKPHQRDCYITSDGFSEQGKSGVIYILRKSRPTIALRETKDGGAKGLCALCMHPIAYYTGTWAGMLPPSDEVLAHLLMIRTDEHLYWKRCNQISLDRVESGL